MGLWKLFSKKLLCVGRVKALSTTYKEKVKRMNIDEMKNRFLDKKLDKGVFVFKNEKGEHLIVEIRDDYFSIKTYQHNNYIRENVYTYDNGLWIEEELYDY